MLDIKQLRTSPESIVENLKRRGIDFDISVFEALESKRRDLQQAVQALQNKRNQASKQIGVIKAQGGDVQAVLTEVSTLGDDLKSLETQLEHVLAEINTLLLSTPNTLQDDVPAGRDENDNVEVRRVGEPPVFDFSVKDHTELGELNGLMDFDSAAKLSGSRFVVLRRELAQLQRALAQFMLDTHINEHGYDEVYVPYLVHEKALYGTGQLPKFADDQFMTTDDQPMVLIPTAEVSVTNLVCDTVLETSALPLKYVAHTPCFRREAGSYGRDTRGMIRQHQFEKVEMVQIVHPDASEAAHHEMLEHAERILALLELPYRVVTLCAGDTGFSAAKTYDIEVWLPSQQAYREISSISNTQSFQARRMQARFKPGQGQKPEFVHTLNGSGVAVGRALVAVMENYQTSSGAIRVPDVLQPYMQGKDMLKHVDT